MGFGAWGKLLPRKPTDSQRSGDGALGATVEGREWGAEVGGLTPVRGSARGRCAQQVPSRDQLASCHSPLLALRALCAFQLPALCRTQPRPQVRAPTGFFAPAAGLYLQQLDRATQSPASGDCAQAGRATAPGEGKEAPRPRDKRLGLSARVLPSRPRLVRLPAPRSTTAVRLPSVAVPSGP